MNNPKYGEWIETKDALPDKEMDWLLGTFQEIDTGWINPIPFVCEYAGKVTKTTTKEGWRIRDCTDVDNPLDYYLNLRCLAWTVLPELYYKIGE